ncbi:serine O-acetyltransferase [Hyphococcus flavus]|uniref:Serine acetyltransferase n=1 Tax=Hyphococcus flavus TaxID=1866326 RepID=A0AAE9ZD30_9PROT|nr:serine O-acetyltransferase [Hyphococcus flavus]WDI30257.1 serine O-acetyltransferase [Hyphococcus flavus]
MSEPSANSSNVVALTSEQTWSRMRVEAATAAASEPVLASFLHATILNHETFKAALSYRLAQKLSDLEMNAMLWREVCAEAYEREPQIVEAALFDLRAAFNRDPACHDYMQPFLYYKGYQALQAQKTANWLWRHDRKPLALYLQSRMSELFAVDIHPATKIGKGVFIDHATGVVIGETAVVEDDVSILQNVTLGGTGKDEGDRHPKIRRGALISVGAKVLGNIEVGEGAKVAAGSVVLKAVEPHCTVAGVPAKPVGACAEQSPSETMDQNFYYDTYSI